MPILTNTARADATFGPTQMYDTSTLELEIPSIKVDKTSDATDGTWVGDVLTYTVTIINIDENIEATGLKFTDTIEPSLARLVENSVVVDNTPLTIGEDFTYNATTGLLTIPNPDSTEYSMPNIPVGSSYDVTFRVTKV